MDGNAKYYIAEQMKPVIGATITEIVFDEDFPGIRVKDKKGKETTLWIQSDPEGNGPGWITVEKD